MKVSSLFSIRTFSTSTSVGSIISSVSPSLQSSKSSILSCIRSTIATSLSSPGLPEPPNCVSSFDSKARYHYSLTMSFWTCSSCTFVNQSSFNACEICEQSRRSASTTSSSSSAFPSPFSSQDADSLKWSCRACTFLNKESDNVCDICGTQKSSISLNALTALDSSLDVDEDEEDGSDRNATFWPLRSCSRSESKEGRKDVKETPQKSSTVDFESISVSASKSSMSNSKRKVAEQIDLDKDELSPFISSRKRKVAEEIDIDSEDSVPIVSSRKRKMTEGNKLGKDDSSNGVPKNKKLEDSQVSNSVLGKLHLERLERRKQSGPASPARDVPSSESLSTALKPADSLLQSIVILTYNVWFREDLELVARMNAIGGIISQHSPHFVCLQEVTPAIYNLFENSSWWKQYQCSLAPSLVTKRPYFCILLSRIANTRFSRKPYPNTIMGRELCVAKVDLAGGKQLCVATTHLESPCPAPPSWNQMYSPERVLQAKEALNVLKDQQNVVFGGDMNWDDKLDGIPPLPEGWCDAWVALRPKEDGLTYDSKENPMLTGSRLRKRLDRLFCHLQHFSLESIEKVGTQSIPGVMYEKEMKVKKETQKVKLPVLPSDHFGLLLKITQQ